MGSVGKHGRVVEVVQHAPEVIGMRMCKHDSRDGFSFDAGCVHVVRELARTGHWLVHVLVVMLFGQV